MFGWFYDGKRANPFQGDFNNWQLNRLGVLYGMTTDFPALYVTNLSGAGGQMAIAVSDAINAAAITLPYTYHVYAAVPTMPVGVPFGFVQASYPRAPFVFGPGGTLNGTTVGQLLATTTLNNDGTYTCV